MKILNHDEFVEIVQETWDSPADFIDDYITEIYELFETGSVTFKIKNREFTLSLKVECNED